MRHPSPAAPLLPHPCPSPLLRPVCKSVSCRLSRGLRLLLPVKEGSGKWGMLHVCFPHPLGCLHHQQGSLWPVDLPQSFSRASWEAHWKELAGECRLPFERCLISSRLCQHILGLHRFFVCLTLANSCLCVSTSSMEGPFWGDTPLGMAFSPGSRLVVDLMTLVL